MATIAGQIGIWLTNDSYPPGLANLPRTMTLASGLETAVRQAHKASVTAGKERGADLGWIDGAPPRLALGTVKEGDEASIMVSSIVTSHGKSAMIAR